MLRHWQDIIFGFGTVVFTVALFPALMKKKYPPVSTCFITAFMLLVYAFADATLGLWISSVTAIFSVSIWATMGVKQINKN